MSRLMYTGFETGDGSEMGSLGSGATVVTSHPRTGTYCLKQDGSTGNSSNIMTGLTTRYGGRTIGLRTGFYIDQLGTPATDQFAFLFAFTDISLGVFLGHVLLNIRASGVVSIGLSNETFATPEVAVNTNAWHTVDVRIGIPASGNASFTWKVDDVQKASPSPAALSLPIHAAFLFGPTSDPGGHNHDVYYDDIDLDSAIMPSDRGNIPILNHTRPRAFAPGLAR